MDPPANKKIYQKPEGQDTMKIVSFLLILCLITLYFSTGCIHNEKLPAEYQAKAIYVSKDPAACKSIAVDCEIYNADEKLHLRWFAFSDESGCGCRPKVTSQYK
jgi:hypothetical protein